MVGDVFLFESKLLS